MKYTLKYVSLAPSTGNQVLTLKYVDLSANTTKQQSIYRQTCSQAGPQQVKEALNIPVLAFFSKAVEKHTFGHFKLEFCCLEQLVVYP